MFKSYNYKVIYIQNILVKMRWYPLWYIVFFRNYIKCLMNAFDIATLGEGSKHRFKLRIPLAVDDMGSVSEFTKKMIFFAPTDDGKVSLKLKGVSYRVPMCLLWRTLREQLVRAMDAALDKAHGSSAELLTHPRDGFEVTDEQQTKNS